MITLSDIKSFVEGNARLFADRRDIKWLALPEHKKEQVAYRAQVCYLSCHIKGKYYPHSDSYKEHRCESCGCETPGKWYSEKACTGEKWPDMLSPDDWQAYKEEHDIVVDYSFLNRILNEDI